MNYKYVQAYVYNSIINKSNINIYKYISYSKCITFIDKLTNRQTTNDSFWK